MVRMEHRDPDVFSKKAHHAMKILSKALKTAKNFERRKLHRKANEANLALLKDVDVHALAEHQIRKKLKLASQYPTNDITARLLNTKPVRQVSLRIESLLGLATAQMAKDFSGRISPKPLKLAQETTVGIDFPIVPNLGNKRSSSTTLPDASIPKEEEGFQNTTTSDTLSASEDIAESSSKNTTFIPSLMAGYWSGSESAEEPDDMPRKNRRGQRARRQMWEKKYGTLANHLKSKRRSTGSQHRKASSVPNRRAVVQRMTAPVTSHTPSVEDLHPSWQAAKELRKQPKAFEGKKIVFD